MASSKKGSAGRSRTSPRPTSARPVTAATRISAGASDQDAVSMPLAAKATTVGGDKSTTAATGASKMTTAATPNVRRSASATATQRQRQRQAQLETQRRRQYISAGFIAALVIALAIGAFLLIPRSGPAKSNQAGSAATTTTGYGILANFTPGTKGNIPGVNATPTNLDGGLQYVDVKVGSGQAVKSTDTITVNYTGWLTDGTKFDSSYDHGKAAQFPLSGVIPGWTKGLVGMQIGGERRLLIPPALAYGAQGQPPTIPGNATLIFDVSLVSIP